MSSHNPIIDQCMIFAAGYGKRLKPLTDHTPKPLIQIGSTTCLDESIQKITKAGIKRIVVNTHHLAEQIHNHLEKNYSCTKTFQNTWIDTSLNAPRNDGKTSSRAKRGDPEKYIIISHEPEILETGGGLVNALPHFDKNKPILIVNGDIWWQDSKDPMLLQLMNAWDPKTMDILLLVIPKEIAIGYFTKGDYFLKPDQRLKHRNNHDLAPYIYGCVTIINPLIIQNNLPKNFSLKILFDQAEDNGRLFGHVHGSLWGDIGSPKGLEDVRKEISI
ncbi:MAG: nucleotidyltransferase family protein [Alphaproteobacteria bacterium]|nr:nucleotidyltransferase family protein [Alphaproteobacteria bacterium]